MLRSQNNSAADSFYSDGIRTLNDLVRKRTLNHLAKLDE